MSDPYLDPASGVLANRAGLTDASQLAQLEAKVVTLRDAELAAQSLPGLYNLAHLQEFHRRLFGDIYAWAGTIRTVDIAKQPTQFCLWHHIGSYANEHVFRPIEADGYLRGLDFEQTVERFAIHLAEVNALHPFREGNGRTQRAFFRQLLSGAGWRVDWAAVDPEENVAACVAAWRGNQQPLEALLRPILTPL